MLFPPNVSHERARPEAPDISRFACVCVCVCGVSVHAHVRVVCACMRVCVRAYVCACCVFLITGAQFINLVHNKASPTTFFHTASAYAAGPAKTQDITQSRLWIRNTGRPQAEMHADQTAVRLQADHRPHTYISLASRFHRTTFIHRNSGMGHLGVAFTSFFFLFFLFSSANKK